VAEEESPFARVPVSSRTEPSSGYTYEGQLERVGELATGLRSRSDNKRLAVIIIVLTPLLALLLVFLGVAAAVVFRLLGG
jgi:hypothetical protein